MSELFQAVGAALEATRPKTSGPSVNVHIVRSNRVHVPDYERMRQEISGERKVEGSIVDQEDGC